MSLYLHCPLSTGKAYDIDMESKFFDERIWATASKSLPIVELGDTKALLSGTNSDNSHIYMSKEDPTIAAIDTDL